MAANSDYKNSKLATVCNAIGSALIIGGVYFCFHDAPVAGVIMLVMAFVFKFLAALISKKKSIKDAQRNQTT